MPHAVDATLISTQCGRGAARRAAAELRDADRAFQDDRHGQDDDEPDRAECHENGEQHQKRAAPALEERPQALAPRGHVRGAAPPRELRAAAPALRVVRDLGPVADLELLAAEPAPVGLACVDVCSMARKGEGGARTIEG